MAPGLAARQNSEMGKKNKPIKDSLKGAPLWFAREWLVALDVSQTRLAAMTGYRDSQISEWVTGTARYNAHVLHRVAKALKINVWDLLRHPSQADDELARLVAGLEGAQRERALRLLIAADLVPSRDKAA